MASRLEAQKIIEGSSVKALLKSDAVCELLSISPATLSRMVASNRIPFILINVGKRKKSVRFSEAELERWIERRSRGAVPQISKPAA